MLRSRLLTAVSIGLLALSQSLVAAGGDHSFSVTLWEMPAAELEFFYGVPGSAHREPLEILEMQRSPARSLPSKYQQVIIYSKGEAGEKKLAAIDLDPAHKSSLIVLKPKEDGSYEPLILEDDPDAPPYGSYLFSNCSELEIEGKLGEEDLKLPAGAKALVAPKVKPKAELAFELWHMPEGTKRYLQRNTFSYNPNKYLILFLYTKTASSGKVQLKSKGLNMLKGEERRR